ncbi:MAG: TldD/PmbA family protein [Bacteroidales bacterium]|nr:TldD/PmbA family protein [Bacteroidales bacterium]
MAITELLSVEEISLAKKCIDFARENGAQKVRITLNKSLMDSFGTLDGKMDKVSHCLDRSINLNLYVDGKYGTFSNNRLEEESLKAFILKAIDTVKMLAPDASRDLADQNRVEKSATEGQELGLLDNEYEFMTAEKRRSIALSAAGFLCEGQDNPLFKVISEEGEYSDSIFDSVVMDSNGTFCRHSETSFEYGVEVTVQDTDGNRYSGFWWDAAPKIADLHADTCYDTAVKRASSQIGPKRHKGGKFTMVVQTDCASKLVTPILNALGGFAIQQNNSFLIDSLGKKLFPDGMTIIDKCRTAGETGSRLFDSEGVATVEAPIIDKGVICQYFINTYMSNKLSMEPTIEDATRPKIMQYVDSSLGSFEGKLTRDDILKLAGNGILVTGFNGGNSNSSTGDFSYGIEGFAFKNGKITHPVREMVVTGNFLTLWNNLIAAGDDARVCTSRLIPTLAFKDVDFSA